MRLVEAMRSGLITRPAVMPRFKLREGTWRNRAVVDRLRDVGPRNGRMLRDPGERAVLHPNLSSR
jgi:hypothetical protein